MLRKALVYLDGYYSSIKKPASLLNQYIFHRSAADSVGPGILL